MVTIKEVAARAGVPEKTAMRALSGRTLGVRRDARERAERVRKAAAELGYQPSAISRALRQGRTRAAPSYQARIWGVRSLIRRERAAPSSLSSRASIGMASSFLSCGHKNSRRAAAVFIF